MKKEPKSVRLHPAIVRQIDNYAGKTEKKPSRVIEESIYLYMDRKDDFEPHESVQKIIEQDELFNDVYAEDFYIKKQNERVSVKLKELTFVQFMDKNISIVYLANKRHMSKDDIKQMMRKSLNSMKDRAKHHGFSKEWEDRYDEPQHYAVEFLEQKSAESKAFEDLIDQL